jgi:hypothetical protein
MAACDRCGAVLTPGALACAYCGAPTAAAARVNQQQEEDARARAQWIANEEQRRALATRAQVQSLATQAVIWGALGALCGCLPLGIVGFVQGMRSRGLAAETKQAAPVTASVGLGLGSLSLLSTIGVFVWAIISTQHKEETADARIAQLTTQIGSQASAPTLDRATACSLAEMYALRTGYAGAAGYTLHGFDCAGKLVPRGDRVELDDFRFQNGTDEAKETYVCFKRGGAWLVEELSSSPCKGGPEPTTVPHVAPAAPAPSAGPRFTPPAGTGPSKAAGKAK